MVVYSMHPTVLRENSSVVSADFPGAARRALQRTVLPQAARSSITPGRPAIRARATCYAAAALPRSSGWADCWGSPSRG